MKTAEIQLPYYKQGDDLSHHVEQHDSAEEALEAHAEQLEYAAQLLRKISQLVAGQGMKIEADTHWISISGSDEIIEALLDAKYALKPWTEDEEDYEEPQDEPGPRPRGWDSAF